MSEPGGDPKSTFWQNEDMDVDQSRKLVLISRDPRSYRGSTSREPGEADPNGATNIAGVYVVDAKNPADLKLLAFEQLPTGHTTTCINHCRWLWTGGPAATNKQKQAPLNWAGGRPIIVTDLRDPAHPVGHTMDPIDLFRRDGVTAYSHDVQVDDMGIAWVSGDGGTRGYWTEGRHRDPLTGKKRCGDAAGPDPVRGRRVRGEPDRRRRRRLRAQRRAAGRPQRAARLPQRRLSARDRGGLRRSRASAAASRATSTSRRSRAATTARRGGRRPRTSSG